MEKIRLMLVEDEALVAKEIEETLKRLGRQVTSTVDTGAKSIERAGNDNPDIVLIDIQLEGEVDGIEAADIIQSRFKIPVVFLTAQAEGERYERAKLIQPYGYVFKPIQDRDLKTTIEMALNAAKINAEKRKNEEELRKSNNLLSIAFDAIKEGVFALGADFKYTCWNKSMEEIFQTPREDVLGAVPWEKFPFLKGQVEQGMKKAMNGEIQRNVETRYRPADGTAAWASDSYFPLKDSDGGVSGVIGVVEEIREGKESKEQLKTAHERLMKILDSVPANIYISDMNTFEILYMNAHMKMFFGKDFSGEKCWKVFRNNDEPCPHCNNPDLMDENGRPTGVKIWEGHNPVDNKFYLNYDQAIQWLDDKFVRIQIATDISEQKHAEAALIESEEKHRHFFENSPIGIVYYDKSGTITNINNALIKIFGSKFKDQIGTNIEEVSEKGFVGKVKRSLSGEYAVYEGWYTSPIGGRTSYIEASFAPIKRDGAIISGVGIIEDVTEKKKTRELMIQTEKIMSVGGLAAGMAHELNNPLGSILQSAQNIQRRISPDLKPNLKIAEECGVDLKKLMQYMRKRNILTFIKGIQESGARAAKIISDMLQFSRKSESSMAPIDLHKLISNTLEMAGKDFDLNKKYDFRNIKITTEFDPELPVVPCVETEIEQVLLNLLRNSAQALYSDASQREPRITLRTKLEEDYALIEIEDNGPGVEKENEGRIFEPFFTTKTDGEGTGLGLSVSYMIVTANHDGTMEFETSLGKRTKMIIRLPLKRPI